MTKARLAVLVLAGTACAAAMAVPLRSQSEATPPAAYPLTIAALEVDMSRRSLLLVPALVPDVAVLHVQRADEDGRAHFWGTLGVTRPAALAARRVIIVAEEIRPRHRILSDPGLVLTPETKVVAVVHEPFGAYPSPVQGCYRRHHDFFGRFHDESRTVEGNRAWLDRFIHGVDDWQGFLGVVGADVLDTIRITRPLPSDPLDYGA